MGYVPHPSSLLLFIVETGSYDVARAGLNLVSSSSAS